MVSKAVKSAIASALGALILGISATDGGAAEGTGKTSPESPPRFFKVFNKDGSESLTADCTSKNKNQERDVPTEITCRFIDVRFQPPRSSDDTSDHSNLLALTLEEVVKSDPEIAAEFRKDPQKARNEWDKVKQSTREMFCSTDSQKMIESQIAALDTTSNRKRLSTDLINACSKGDSLAEIFRILSEEKRTTCDLWVDHFDLDFRRIDQGKWLFTQQRPGLLSGTLKIYELAAEPGYGLWTLTETRMTTGQKEDAGSKPLAERSVWSWKNWGSYEIPGECRYISYRLVQYQ